MEKTALPVHDATANHRPRHEIKIKIQEERSRNLDSAPSARVISLFIFFSSCFLASIVLRGNWIKFGATPHSSEAVFWWVNCIAPEFGKILAFRSRLHYSQA